MNRQNSSSLVGAGLIAALIGLVFILGPTAGASAAGVNMPAVSRVILVAFGVALLIGGAGVITITRMYKKASANRAFVITGSGGGARVIIDGGALVIPVLHEITWVSLETMRLEVQRHGEEALLTKDYLRADITAQFFVKVHKEKESVLTAATTLGGNAVNQTAIEQVIGEKLVSAARQVANEMELEELMLNRQDFIKRMSEQIGPSILSNGLTLEDVTISKLDQTPRDAVAGDKNIFDARGLRRATEIITEQQVERNRIELDGKKKIETERVATQQQLNQQQVIVMTADAERDQKIKIAQAEAQQLAETKAAEQRKLAEVAKIEAEQAIAVAQQKKDQATEVADQERQRAVRTAEIAREQATDVADRDRQIAVTERETARANTQAQLLAAEAERTRREQEVTTVTVTAEAERKKATTVIAAQAAAEQRKLDEQTQADVAAYKVVAQAKGEQESAARRAEATLTAARATAESATIEATAQANATKLRAEADSNAATLRAQGAQAEQLVPVIVERERVAVSAAQVEVLKQELQAKSDHEGIARELQVDLARIDAEKEVQIAQANAAATAFAQANITLWGTPDQVQQVTNAFMQGQSFASTLQGIGTLMPDGLSDVVSAVVGTIAGVAKEKGVDVDVSELTTKATEAVKAGRHNRHRQVSNGSTS